MRESLERDWVLTPLDADEITSTLNQLIETCSDGAKGFRNAADEIRDPQIRSLFIRLGRERADCARELQDVVREHGGEPEKHGSTSGAIHRMWIDLRSSISSQDNYAVLAECERGEDHAKIAYEKALSERHLASDVMQVIRRQYLNVKVAHDRVRELRDAFKK